MLQKSTQWIMDRLVERALPSVGGFMASALQRMLILGHAEHHNQLEEQARRYEASGKPQLAKMIREEAGNLSMTDPFSSAPAICDRLTDEANDPQSLSIALPEPKPARKRGKRKSTASSVQAVEDTREISE